jgi:hypothetical protein
MISGLLSRIFRFYYDGFKSMTIGKTLWAIILIKLFVMFVILKIFFFPNFLKSNFENDEDSSDGKENLKTLNDEVYDN